MKRTITWIITGVVVSMMAVGTFAARGSHCGGDKGMGSHCGMGEMQKGNCYDKIPDLTDAQKSQIEEIATKKHEEMKMVHEKMWKLREELGKLSSENGSDAAVNAKIDEISKVHGEMLKNQLACRAEIEKILTPAQREYLEKNMGPGCGLKGGKMQGKGGCHNK